jgi:hypothetical protein
VRALDFGKASGSVGYGLERSRSLWERFHIDPPLLCALLVVLSFGLLVLQRDGRQRKRDAAPGQLHRVRARGDVLRGAG